MLDEALALAQLVPAQAWAIAITALAAVVLLILIPSGSVPRTIASGSWPATALNTGRWRVPIVPTTASSSGYAGSFIAILANGLGAFWIVDGAFTLYNQTGAVVSRPCAWAAGATITITVDVSGPTGSITIEGCTTGNGTFTFANSGTYFVAAETLGVGVYNTGGYNFVGTIGAVDDAALPVTGTSSSTLGAIGGGTAGGSVATATSAAALASVVGASSATLLDPVTGTSSVTLGAIGGAAAGNVIDGTVAHSSVTLGAIGGAAAAVAPVAGGGSGQLGRALGAAAAAVAVVASSAATLAAIAGAASTAPPVPALAMGVSAVVQRIFGGAPTTGTLSTSAITTGDHSAFVGLISRGQWAIAPAPVGLTDSFGNTYSPLPGAPHVYPSPWTSSFHALYTSLYDRVGDTWPIGGAGHQFRGTWGDYGGGGDEVTVAGWQIVGARVLQSHSYVSRATAATLTSGTVTTTGPALLLAVALGTGPTGQTHVVTFNDGFTKLAAASAEGNPDNFGYIQESSAYKLVTDPGTYSVSLSYAIPEGAEIYLLAFQAEEGVVGSSSLSIGRVSGPATASSIAGASSSAAPAALRGTTAATAEAGGASARAMGALGGGAAAAVAIAGASAGSVAKLAGVASSGVAIAGTSTARGGPLVGSASAGLIAAATSTAALGAIVGAADASTGTLVAVNGSSTAQLGAIGGGAAGAVLVVGATGQVLRSITGVAQASTLPAVIGTSAGTLGAIGGVAAAAVTDGRILVLSSTQRCRPGDGARLRCSAGDGARLRCRPL